MEVLDVSDFPIFVVGCRKNRNYLQDFNAFGWKPFIDWAENIVGMGYKTGPTTPPQIDGARLSETKGAHKS